MIFSKYIIPLLFLISIGVGIIIYDFAYTSLAVASFIAFLIKGKI